MLKILHITSHYLPFIGGSSLRLKNLLSFLMKENDCEIHLLALKHKKNLPSEEKIDNVFVYRVNNFYQIPSAVRKIVFSENIDIIHTHNLRPCFFTYLAFLRNKPIILEMHAIYEVSPLKLFLTKVLFKKVDKIVVLANASKEHLIQRRKALSEKIIVIPNGVDFKKFNNLVNPKTIRQKYQIREKYIVGYVGSFDSWQGVLNLIKSASYLLCKRKDIRFLVVGDGPDFKNIQDLIRKEDLKDKVIITGNVDPREIPIYISAMDVFIIPRPSTLATETAVPLKLLEAMAMARPIIATKVKGIEEIIRDKKNGVLIEPNNEIVLAEAVNNLLDSPKFCKKIGANAQKIVQDEYSWEVSAKKLFNLYQGLTTR